MVFVDEARISVKGGDGGKGCESYYRDKYMRYPDPDGGNGGEGGSVIVQASRSVHTLLDFKYTQHFRAQKGGIGSSKGKNGKSGKDSILRVPVGTIVKDEGTGLLIKDLVEDQQSVTVAKGGKPGIGNARREVPEPPGLGEERLIKLELKVIADVGIVGFPNAGKSTLISNISRVKSKVANYPFTTKSPILGLVSSDDFNFVVADLPGIIEGAHLGKGLGDRFLKHAERTKILLHLIDMAGSEGRDPLDDFEKIEYELKNYGEILNFKTKLVVANKMDLPEAAENLKQFKKKYKKVKIMAISAMEKQGLDKLVETLKSILCQPESSQEK